MSNFEASNRMGTLFWAENKIYKGIEAVLFVLNPMTSMDKKQVDLARHGKE